MIKEIKYKGYTANPSDYECNDGELAMSLNAIYEDGALRPVMEPKFISKVSAGDMVKCVHKTGNYTHYIIVDGDNALKYKKDNLTTTVNSFSSDIEIYQITPVGNTLIVLTSDGMYYFLWKDDKYIGLGNELPELNVKPFITTQAMNRTSVSAAFGTSSLDENNCVISGNDYIPVNTLNNLLNNTMNSYAIHGTIRQNVYERCFAIINHYNHFFSRKGYFMAPFYVRFAFRMFDGTHTRHTVPVLLVPFTWGKPLMSTYIKTNDSTTTAIFDPIFFCSSLFANINVSDNIDEWSDIITDIDVFVTEPLIDYSDDPESVVSLQKMPFVSNPELMPQNMHVGVQGSIEELDNYSIFVNTDVFVESLNKDRIIITPYSELGVIITKNLTNHYAYIRYNFESLYNLYGGGYIGIDTQGYKIDMNQTNTLGQTIPWEVFEGNIPEAYKELTIFKINEGWNGVVTLYFENPKEMYDELGESTSGNNYSVRFKSYIILPLEQLNCDYYIDIKRSDGKNYTDVLEQYNTFYNIAEINLQELTNNEFSGLIPIKELALQKLQTRPVLEDLAYGIHNPKPHHFFAYNNRLNIILDDEQIRATGVSITNQNPCSGEETFAHSEDKNKRCIKKAYVEIYENSQKAYVEVDVDNNNFDELRYFAFPHNQAKNLYLYVTTKLADNNSDYKKYKIPLKQHPFLNLSYAFNMFKCLRPDKCEEQCSNEDDFIIPSEDTIHYGNIIRLSDVNNPFRFSEKYSVSLPVSKIYALSTAAKALSQGQFGQYPLYAFTSDGIWALEVSSTGSYSARQPISRDVVINPDSITQIDNAVLFATNRGIMLISGSEVMCISDRINTFDIFDIVSLPSIDVLIKILPQKIPFENPSSPPPQNPTNPPQVVKSLEGSKDNTDMSVPLYYTTEDFRLLPFLDFVKDCKMIYDYTNQHIIVYNPDVEYAYVYSLKSQEWGMMLNDIRDNVDSYPEALAVSRDNKLVDFSNVSDDTPTILVITRPFKMEEPNIHKTINTIIQRGNMLSKEFAQILYGSNDLNNWVVVWSSSDIYMGGFRGTPYKYFRIALARKTDKSESLQGFSLQYEPRLTNKLR